MKEIRISQCHLYAIVDDEFYDIVMSHSRLWRLRVNSKGEINGITGTSRILKRRVILSTLILGVKEGYIIDHKNRNPLDNRKENLRFATHQQNAWNRKPYGKSGYKGVYQDDGRLHWKVEINFIDPATCRFYKKGGFETARQAALHANEKYREFHGEFAYQNPVE